MTLDRADRTGLGVAVIGHILLFGALSLSFLNPPRPLPSMNAPIDVELVGPEQVAPDPVPSAAEAAAASAAPEPVPAPPIPEPIVPPPLEMPKPKAEAVKPRPAPKASPPKAVTKPPKQETQRRGTGIAGLGTSLAEGARTEGRGQSRALGTEKGDKGTQAAKSGVEIRRTISVSINAEVRGPWNACRVSGVDIDQLQTSVQFRLDQDGSLAGITNVKTSGVNDSNRFQQARFEECAKNAIARAAPFALPREDYAYWKSYTLDFSKR